MWLEFKSNHYHLAFPKGIEITSKEWVVRKKIIINNYKEKMEIEKVISSLVHFQDNRLLSEIR